MTIPETYASIAIGLSLIAVGALLHLLITAVQKRREEKVTKVLGLSGTGGSDAHSVQGLGKGSTMFRGDIRNELDLLEALRAGEFIPVEGFHVGRPTYYGGNSNGGGSPWSTAP